MDFQEGPSRSRGSPAPRSAGSHSPTLPKVPLSHFLSQGSSETSKQLMMGHHFSTSSSALLLSLPSPLLLPRQGRELGWVQEMRAGGSASHPAPSLSLQESC